MAIGTLSKATLWSLRAALAASCVCIPTASWSNSNTDQTAVKSEASSSVPRYYQRWLDEDVRWIITPDERAAFLRLSKNEERDQFIEEFWRRRNPTPGRSRNPFKEEHYRRIAYANVHFAWQSLAGWKTDRGRIYIVLGEPDAIQVELGSGDASKRAEVWHYGSPKRNDKDFRFVDICGCGDYRLAEPGPK